MCKIDLKYVYFAISLSVKSRRYVRFQWKGLLYEFCCLCFGLSPAPLVFTKLLKVPISLSLEKAHCRNNNLPRWHATNDIFIRRSVDGKRFIFQHLRFLINIKESYLEPTSTLEFLGVIVDSGEMSLPKEKLLKVQNHCQEILEKGKITVRKLSKLIGRLSSTAIAVLPAPLLLSSSSTSPDWGINLSQPFRGESGNFGGGKERTVIGGKKLNSVQREILNFSPTINNNNKLRCIITRLGSILITGGGGGEGEGREGHGLWRNESFT